MPLVSPEDIIQAVYDAATNAIRTTAQLAAPSPGVPEHHNGSIDTTPQPVNFSGTSTSILFRNTHLDHDLLISFDGGTTFLTLPPSGVLSLETAVSGVVLKGSDVGTTYEGLAVV